MKTFRPVHALLTVVTAMIFSQTAAANVAPENKVVVIDGSLTEIVYALNAESQIVAVDQTSVFPAQAKKLPNIGYMRALSAEGILSVQPKIVITTSSAGPILALESVKKAGVDVNIIANQYSVQGVMNKIDAVAKLLNKLDNAKQLKQSIQQALVPLQPVLQGQLHEGDSNRKPRVLLFLGMQGNQLMAAGQHTQAQAMMDILHADNAASDFHGYKPMNKEAVLAANADAIIVVTHTNMPEDKIYAQFSYTKAATDKRLLIADSSLLLGFSPRIAQALTKMTSVVYPQFKL
ncbi:MAG: ABC transporter substrate-binding protein [Pseudomonadales bacterium]|nr:ABC transporter substrate-binding protein [Pseudomonadales bacterium]